MTDDEVEQLEEQMEDLTYRLLGQVMPQIDRESRDEVVHNVVYGEVGIALEALMAAIDQDRLEAASEDVARARQLLDEDEQLA